MYQTKIGINFMLLIAIVISVGCGNTNQKNQRQAEPPSMDIHTAVFMEDLPMIQHIAAGSDLNFQEPGMGSSPLISAAVFGKTAAAKALIEAGADLNLQNNEGSTALLSAAFLCRVEIVEMLLAKGADKEIQNKTGATALSTVSGAFDQVKPIYDIFSKDLGPLGFKLDYDYLRKTRPTIAEMLK